VQISIGLVLALVSAVAVNWAYSREHDAAAGMPAFSARHPRRFVSLLVADRGWLVGFATETAGWLVYVAALRLAPISLVQAVCASGIAVLAFATAHGQPSRLARHEKVAVAVAFAGLVLLAFSLVDSRQADHSPAWAAVTIWLVCSVGAALMFAGSRVGLARGPAFGLAAGLLFAGGDISAKLVVYGGIWFVAVISLIVCYALGTSVLQAGFQHSNALTAAGLATLTTNAVPIAAGFVLFGEQLPHGAKGTLQLAAFASLVVSAAFLARAAAPTAAASEARQRRVTDAAYLSRGNTRGLDTVVRVDRLTKFYGASRGIIDTSFEVSAGEIFGFLGPNGAGKSTTIRLMLDLIRPTSGRIDLFGLDPQKKGLEIRRRVGYVPGDLRLYERLTPRDLLRYFAHLRGMRDLGDAPRLVERLELELDRPIRSLSKGNRQKVGLVQALMHRPELLVLDEPTSGLDPLVQQTFNELLREATGEGRTVFLSSHMLGEVQRVADRVALVREGRIELVEEVETLRRRAFTRVEVSFADTPPGDAFAGIPGVRALERRGDSVLFALEGPADPLVKALARHHVLALDIHEADLEDIFLTLYRSESTHAE
jgi:ABC-2 type transport system ATP-binding protein